ncbi:SFT2-domain-containing protein [Piromyces finnis]|uniref:Protein transport protein SFT2 n=1 Tax=Piromyces finnis TaxID=1754191 RepID=A0A1Y1VB13_9FUNG|nr:SFT2-domain-containing protein [Piromyces finnis]|eukprot:ORX51447.1 SFT2-domain-containing protein [Piromyces finnis]
MSAEQAFRDSLNSFQSFGTSNNNNGGSWFSRLGLGRNSNSDNEENTSLLGNLRARASDGLSNFGFGGNEEEDDNPFGLSRFQRYVTFLIFCGAGALCFILSIFSLSLLNPKKFAALFTFGSVLVMLSFGILNGPKTQLKSLLAKERIPYTIIYILSMLLSLYAAIIKSSLIWTILASIIQLLALLWFVFTYLPNGTSSLSRMTRSILPI